MKQACFYSINNPHETGQNDLLQNRIKNMLGSSSIKQFLSDKLKYLIAFCLIIFLTGSAFAVDINVTGITSPSAANGTYILKGTTTGAHSGAAYSYWKHSTQNYYIWCYEDPYFGDPYWVIDTNTLDDGNSLFQALACCEGNSPIKVISWEAFNGLGSPSVSEITVNPEINIKGNGASIASGSGSTSFSNYTKFGSALPSSGNATRTFTIENTGSAVLTIGAISFSGANAGEFTVTSAPAASVAALGSTTFTVRFAPTGTGNRTATISIPNNDSDESTYTFAIDGYGYTPTTLLVSGFTTTPPEANEIYISQGVLNGFQYWKHRTLNYYIYNVNGTTWIIDNNLTSPDGFLANSSSAINIPTGLTWTNGSYIPEGGSTNTASTGTVEVTGIPATREINVKGYNGINIVNGDNTPSMTDQTHFGSAGLSTSGIIRTFTILNEGGTTLNLTGSSPYVAISGANASDFTVTAIPSSSIASCNSTTFQITFIPSAGGTRTATVTITNNDSDEGTFTFDIKGEGIFPQTLNVSGITAPAAACGNYTYQGIMNNFAYWRHTSGSYYIYNALRSNNTNDWFIDADLDYNTNSVFETYYNSTSLSPVGITDWARSTGSLGSPVITSLVPEINVQGNSTSIADEDVTPSVTDDTDFGSTNISLGTVSHTFTIQNTGSGILYLYGTPKVAISGANASDFTVTAQPTSPVAATTGATTFTVQFDPSATGIRTAAISISNNDNDENPYNFSIQGTGVLTPTVTGISPTNGSTLGGTLVSITGSNLTGATAVMFGATSASITANTATSITATSPAGTGTVDVKVTTPGGTSATSTNDQFTYAAPGTFTQATSTDWATASNWIGGVPTSATDVIIPSGKTVVISATTQASCNNLTVNGSLTIQSSASGTGSLIIKGTSSGTVSAERYMTGNKWHIVAPIAAFGSISTFIQASGNAIPLKDVSGTNRYGMMDYNEATNTWNNYYAATTLDILPAGKGYSLRRTSDGIVTFIGDLTGSSETKLVGLTKGGTGWNCIGNPYTSAINMNNAANATNNFLKTNSYILDDSYACIYVWDDATLSYKILGNVSFDTRDLGQNVLQAGQGFFVKAASAGVVVQFTNDMQVHQTTTPFKAPAVTTSWPGITLTATSAATSSAAIITFNRNMTKGLDPTYDAGLLRGTNGLSLYTRLVEDNGVDFAIQCLPESYNNLIIPVGVDSKDGGEITFSTETANLPADCKVILEDKTTNTFTSLTDGATYKTTVAAGSTAVGRFYIRTSGNTTTGTSGVTAQTSSLKAYIANEAIIIEGEVGDQAIATLYNLQGLKVRVNPLQKGSLNTLPCSDLMKGIYLLTIQQNGETATRKLIKE